MKNVITAFLALGFVVWTTVGYAQPLNATESPFQKLTEHELHFLQQYSESNRWARFYESEAAAFKNAGPVFVPTWENMGPNTIDTLAGRMLSLVFHPDDPNIIFAGSGAGGLWKSVNAGEDWEALTDDLPSMRVSAVAINPNNPDEILIGTGIGKVVSTALQPGVGVLKSTNGGETWSETSFSYDLTQIVSTYKLVYDPFVEDKVYLAATNGFFISNDGGDNWTSTNTSRIYDIELHSTEEGVIYIGTHLIGVQKSNNGGLNWTTLNNGIPSGSGIFRTEVALCESQPNIVMAKLVNNNTFNDIGLYKSTDDGNNWAQLPNAPNVSCQPSNPSACSGWVFNTLGIAPDDPDKIYMGGVQFWYTHDGGNTWIWKDYLSNGTGGGNVNLVYVDHWDIDFDPATPGRMYVCCDGGVIRSDDYGITWTRMSHNLINAMMYSSATHPDDPNLMIGGFHDHGLQRWIGDPGNQTWTRWSLNDGVKTLFDPQASGVIYGNIQNGSVRKSFSNGSGISSTFVANNGIQEFGPWISPLVMNPSSPNTLYTATTTTIYKTTNGANSWFSVANFPNVQILELNEIDPEIIYAHAYNPFNSSTWAFYRSDNGGTDWAAITDPSIPGWGVTALASDPHQAGRIYAVYNTAFNNFGHIKRSDNHGDTWTDITNDFPDIKVNDILVSPYKPEHLFLATDLGIYFSENGGDNWCAFNNNLPRIYSMHLHVSEADSTLRVATFGRGVWKTSLADLPVSLTQPDEYMPDYQVDLFPNPTTDKITFRIRAEGAVSMKADLYDAQGRKIKRLFSHADKTVLESSVGLGSDLAPGTYFVRLLLGDYVYHRPLVVH